MSLPVDAVVEPVDTSRTEPKVKWSAVGQYLAGLIGLALFSGLTDGNLIGALPDWAAAILLPLLPTIAGALAGYNAEHQYRVPELPKAARP